MNFVVSPCDPLLAPLIGELNRRHEKRLLLHAWRAECKREQQLIDKDRQMIDAMEEEIDRIWANADDDEWLVDDIAVAMMRYGPRFLLTCGEVVAEEACTCNNRRNVYRSARYAAAEVFVNEESDDGE